MKIIDAYPVMVLAGLIDGQHGETGKRSIPVAHSNTAASPGCDCQLAQTFGRRTTDRLAAIARTRTSKCWQEV